MINLFLKKSEESRKNKCVGRKKKKKKTDRINEASCSLQDPLAMSSSPYSPTPPPVPVPLRYLPRHNNITRLNLSAEDYSHSDFYDESTTPYNAPPPAQDTRLQNTSNHAPVTVTGNEHANSSKRCLQIGYASTAYSNALPPTTIDKAILISPKSLFRNTAD